MAEVLYVHWLAANGRHILEETALIIKTYVSAPKSVINTSKPFRPIVHRFSVIIALLRYIMDRKAISAAWGDADLVRKLVRDWFSMFFYTQGCLAVPSIFCVITVNEKIFYRSMQWRKAYDFGRM